MVSTSSQTYFYSNIKEILDNAENTLIAPNIFIGGEDYNNDTKNEVINGKISFIANSSTIQSVDILFFVEAKMNVYFSKIF